MKKLIVLIIFIGAIQTTFAQDKETEWKPYLHITGYVNTIAEYTDLENYKEYNNHISAGLSDAAFLASYKPLKNLEFKGTFVYFHNIQDIQSLLVEAYGTYTFDQKLKVSTGKFLTPLSPVNLHFYAPMNISGVLPMTVSHHAFMPQSISGLQVAGEFGEETTLGYNLTYGTYQTVAHPRQGIISLQGVEDLATYFPNPGAIKPPSNFYMGGSAKAYLNYRDIVKVGFNYFEGTRATQTYGFIGAGGYELKTMDATHRSGGVDLSLNISNLKFSSEIWQAKKVTTKDAPIDLTSNYSGFYAELSYNWGIITPFVRYEYLDDINGPTFSNPDFNLLYSLEYKIDALGVGINIRPIYEIMVKLDYRYIMLDPAGTPQGKIYNPEQTEYSHFVLSAVFSF